MIEKQLSGVAEVSSIKKWRWLNFEFQIADFKLKIKIARTTRHSAKTKAESLKEG